MTDEKAPLPLKPIVAGILCGQFILAAALATYMALHPPAGKAGGLSINLIANIMGPAFLLTLPLGVPLILLARRNLRDPALGRRDWAGTGLYAGFIGGGLGGLALVGITLANGDFEAVVLLLAVGFVLSGMVLGGVLAFIARPISHYFASRSPRQ